MSEYFVENETSVLDVGCSTGSFLFRIWEKNRERAPQAKYVGIDIEPNFAASWTRFNVDSLGFHVADVRSVSIPKCCSLVTSIFSLQFIAQRDRQNVLDRIFQALVPGGALILAEKTLSKCSKLHEMLTSLHYDYKRQSFTDEEILEKERSLRAALKLWSEEQIIHSLLAAGFDAANVQPFWRNHAFAAFLALR
jgi:tRNA (cmo5U34)-methyltransferase